MKNHKFANLLPMMQADEFAALVEDIKQNGLRRPIITYKGEILDGRNRLLACKKAEVKPKFEEFKGDEAEALKLVKSENIKRRNLTAAQRAVVAAREWGLEEKEVGRPSKENVGNSHNKPSIRQLAEEYQVDTKSIMLARDIARDAPDIAEEVANRLESLEGARAKIQERIEQEQNRKAEVEKKKKAAAVAAKYSEAVSNNEMALEEAIQKALEEEEEKRRKEERIAEAHRKWWEDLNRYCEWVESYIKPVSDEQVSAYARPDSPQQDRFGVDTSRLTDAVNQLQRILNLSFPNHRTQKESRNGHQPQPKQQSGKQRAADARRR